MATSVVKIVHSVSESHSGKNDVKCRHKSGLLNLTNIRKLSQGSIFQS